ncbi:NapC/NirT family cytochrome c [Mangrovibacterium marinum]|uniref:NapC/NirT cytochrome c family protein n=1 Tax=Mangrovibacterium marinum TaxID=1639118 RepID=A0A2T5BZL8_9BACT|nr:NapC/NirT family cytochrome c [Mangrovibacterium marinum]PTN07739.1 NapC/NirT cytochrome c family protein [Mangrovibacterium marinum]
MKLPSSIKNWISITGAVLAIFNLASILSLMLLSYFFGFGGSYIGLFIYIVLPVFMILGLILIPVGMRLYRKKARKAEQEGKRLAWPVMDFNNVAVRNASIIFIVGTVFLLIISSVGSYEAFHYTESVEFCGKLCHQVMEPEYTTYHGSSHERVACVACHVGSGASWYVKSKMSGLYQVYSVLANKYPKPIPTPIANLRPAQETCEECHWPEKFYDWKLRIQHSFLADDQNTENIVYLQIKTSSKNNSHGIQKGIHQHISPDVKIEYKTLDDKRQVIPWVRYTNTKTGASEVYTDHENPVSQSLLDSMETRVMDCLDCHNRPSHDYQVPQNFIDKLMAEGKIPKTLPSIKLLAVTAMNQDYSSRDSAFLAIDAQVKEYYELVDPDVLASRKDEVEQAIAAIQQGYANNIFPEMKVSWKSYANNIGHMEADGCFRCHNDRHATPAGKLISKDCNLCHDILAQGMAGDITYSSSFESLEFIHPMDIGEDWKTENCSTCHSALY